MLRCARPVAVAFRLRREGRRARALTHRRCVRDACVLAGARRCAHAGCCVLLQPAVGGDSFTDDSSETAKVRRLSKENRTLRHQLKELQLEATEEKEEVDSLIEELSKEIIELCVGSRGCFP